jgi:hypothetical protein
VRRLEEILVEGWCLDMPLAGFEGFVSALNETLFRQA